MAVLTITAATQSFNAKTRHHRVRCWGGGGTGGAATGNPAWAGGGAGGQYAEKRCALNIGEQHDAEVAQVMNGGTASAIAGQYTALSSQTDILVIANGGDGGPVASANNSAGLGAVGNTTDAIGDVVYPGGDGGAGVVSTVSGGGGGGADETGAGNAGVLNTPGAAKGSGGAGGAGVSVANTRNAGASYGGGGSGGYTDVTTNRAGGAGAAGLCIVDWIPPASLLLLGCG